MNLVNVIKFGVNSIFISLSLCIFLEKCYWIDYTGEPDQKEVLVKVNFLYICHYWYLERKCLLLWWWKRSSLYLLVFQKENICCKMKDSTRNHLNLGDICNQCIFSQCYISREPKSGKYCIELQSLYYWYLHGKFCRSKLYY